MTPEDLEDIRSTLEFASNAGAKDEFMETAYSLLEHVDAQAAQISELKEKLISERMKSFEDWDGDCLDADIECPDPRNPAECHGCEIYERARQQLKAEMPGVEWE